MVYLFFFRTIKIEVPPLYSHTDLNLKAVAYVYFCLIK